MGENNLAYASEWAFLSSMYQCPIRYEGIGYLSCEQALQHTRATRHGAHGKAERILLAYDAFASKRIGGTIEKSEDWLNQREEIYRDINLAKFQQNPLLKAQLLETGDKILQEATVDSFWGIGAGIRSKATREATATSKNRAGVILMDIRAQLKEQV